MAGKIAGVLAKNILKESAENRFGQEDPYFERVPATNLLGKPTTKKQKKAIPDGISAHDAKVLTKVKRRAHRLDLSLFNFCGIKFGWGSLIALVPAIGDALDMCMALMVVASCRKIEGGIPGNLQMHMLLNVVLDFFIGLIPFIGDLADAMYKCNTRNAILLEEYLKKQGQRKLKRPGREMTEIEDGAPETEGYQSPSRLTTTTAEPARPEPARPEPERQPEGDRHKSKKHSGRNKRKPDLEMGLRDHS